jgi:hypothetical protein
LAIAARSFSPGVLMIASNPPDTSSSWAKA